MEKIICLNFVEERTQKCDRENREWRWCQIKSIYRLHLDLVVKQLCYISCLNACATNCATFRNQKLCCCTIFLCLEQTGLVYLEQGDVLTPLLTTRLHLIISRQKIKMVRKINERPDSPKKKDKVCRKRKNSLSSDRHFT